MYKCINKVLQCLKNLIYYYGHKIPSNWTAGDITSCLLLKVLGSLSESCDTVFAGSLHKVSSVSLQRKKLYPQKLAVASLLVCRSKGSWLI